MKTTKKSSQSDEAGESERSPTWNQFGRSHSNACQFAQHNFVYLFVKDQIIIIINALAAHLDTAEVVGTLIWSEHIYREPHHIRSYRVDERSSAFSILIKLHKHLKSHLYYVSSSTLTFKPSAMLLNADGPAHTIAAGWNGNDTIFIRSSLVDGTKAKPE